MRNYSLSANIETGTSGNDKYVVTPNVEKVANEIVQQFQAGIHSFTIIGTYGTGKSCFLLTLEQDLRENSKPLLIKNPKALASVSGYEIINVVGEYQSLENLLYSKLQRKSIGDSTMEILRNYYNRLKKDNKMLLIVVDEFGKVLEHAAKNEVEKELYFMQQLAEFANVPGRNILLLTTLHQSFNAYSSKLSASQKNEWTKVKGRYQEIVFIEPIEQLLYMAALSLGDRHVNSIDKVHRLYKIAQESKFIAPSLKEETVRKLYPLDAFSAIILTKAMQRYGQNERSLFSFLNTNGIHSITAFKSNENCTYSLNEVYDYLIDNFYSYLSDANIDSMGWRAILIAIERVESVAWKNTDLLNSALKTVKTIGLLNILGGAGFSMPEKFMIEYMSLALGIHEAQFVLQELIRLRIIRFAEYKCRYVLFEGTDMNIEEEIMKASAIIPIPTNPIDGLRMLFDNQVASVKAHYYRTGTPRYFEYFLSDEPIDLTPKDDVDGFIEIIFSTATNMEEQIIQFSSECKHAVVFAFYQKTDKILARLHKINVYNHILEKVIIDKSDKVALREINQLIAYEKSLLNKEIKDGLFAYNGNVKWFYKGSIVNITKLKDFNELLSEICKDVYSKTPIIRNELFNRQKLSGSISTARVKYLQSLVKDNNKEDFGFDIDTFPPEKSIYYTLLKATGLHEKGDFTEKPSDNGIMPLWEACEDFLRSTQEKPRKISELIRLLSEQPYKIKTGILDFWIPTYLFMKRLDYSLFGSNGMYIPEINMEFFDLLKKHPSDFSIKAYAEDGIKLEFYNQYRKFINADKTSAIKGDKFIETIKPFFYFYNHLNEYTKHTRKFNNVTTLRFRDVLAKAKDPEKTFFEDLPEALGFNNTLLNHEEFVADYCQIIQKAVRELRSCYSSLIGRIERAIIERLDLQAYEYSAYIQEVRQRLSHIKEHLLSDKQRDFYNHAMAEFDNRQEWIQSICYSALNQPLDKLRDEQEEQLIDNIIYLFRECEKHSVVSEAMNFQVREDERKLSSEIERKIENILTKDNNLNIYALMNVLKKKMR